MGGMSGMGPPPGSGDAVLIQSFHASLARQGLLIFFVALAAFLCLNVLRWAQYRRAVATGEGLPERRRMLTPEPPGRRVARIGFGLLWIFDGLLQLQSAMPANMPTSVLQPAAATSPSWVQHLVGFGVTAWTRHPVSAAAATVWIQLGIGVLLILAPRGRWSRVAGGISVGWALVVWATGEAFGGIFAPGLTALFGAPGAVFFYGVAGVLVALPERAWSQWRLGRWITGGVGAFLIGMGVLQAWPGRGFWQGGSAADPGQLASMVGQMATTHQPHALSSLLSSFESFDIAHGWGVNLFAVVALLVLGASFVSGRPAAIRPALIALVVVGLADWVLVEDLGIWGGTGTDVNSMLPLLLLAWTGTLALLRGEERVRAPAPAQVERAAAAEGSPEPAIPADARGRPWWEGIDTGYAGRLAVAAVAAFVVLVGTVPMAAASVDPNPDPLVAVSVDGAPNVTDAPAADFQLEDQFGRTVSLDSLKGSTVALTFLDPVCTTDCPLIAQEFKVADRMLGASASKVRFVAVVANPLYSSLAVVDAFDRREYLNAPNWYYLTGSTAALTTTLDDYGVQASVVPAGGMVDHSEITYVIDPRGYIRRIMGTDPGDSTADGESFSALLASEIAQVMHS